MTTGFLLVHIIDAQLNPFEVDHGCDDHESKMYMEKQT
jgi:hypothetical protein